jgi:hypothetical protein
MSAMRNNGWQKYIRTASSIQNDNDRNNSIRAENVSTVSKNTLVGS